MKRKKENKTAGKITFRDENEYNIQRTNGEENEFPEIGQH